MKNAAQSKRILLGRYDHLISRQSTSERSRRLNGQVSTRTALPQNPPSNPNIMPATMPQTTQSNPSCRGSNLLNWDIPSTIAPPPREAISATTPQAREPATAEDTAKRQAMLENGNNLMNSHP